MPLQWQTVDVPFIQGIDSKSNDYGNGSQLADLVNGVFTETGVIKRRNGYVQLGTNLTTGNALGVLGSELVSQDGITLKSYSPGGNSWASRGTCRAVPMTSSVLMAGTDSLRGADSASVGGYTAYTWLDGTARLHVSIIDEATGTRLVSDVVLDTGVLRARVIAHTGPFSFSVVYGTSAQSVKLANIPVATLLSTVTTISTSFNVVSGPFLAATSSGNSLWVSYADSNTGVISFKSITASTGVVAWTTTGEAISAGSGNLCWCLTYIGGFLYAVYSSSNPRVTVLVANSGAVAAAPGSLLSGTITGNATICDNGSGVALCLFDNSGGIYSTTIGSNGALGSLVASFRSVRLASEALNIGGAVHFLASYASTVSVKVTNTNTSIAAQNSCLFLMSPTAIVGRAFLGQATSEISSVGFLPHITTTSPNQILVVTPVTVPADAATASGNGSLVATGQVRIDFGSEKYRTRTVGSTLFGTGGAPTTYAGDYPSEHGFSVFPEATAALSASIYTAYSNAIASLGSVFQPTAAKDNGHFYQVVYVPPQVQTLGTEPTYVTNKGTCTTGNGVVMQDVGVRDSAGAWQATHAYAVGTVLTPTTPNGHLYVITANGSGSSTAIEPTWSLNSGGQFTDGNGVVYTEAGTFGTMTAGTFGYVVLHEWTDAAGQLYQSYPSLPFSVTQVSGITPGVVVTVPTLRATVKTGVRISVYRTANNGTVRQRIASVANTTSVDAVAVLDRTSDATQSLGLALYTDAGEIPNEPAPHLTAISVRGQRVYGIGGPDLYSVYCSKLNSQGFGVGFSSLLKVRCDPAGGKLAAIETMDDKTIVFQASRILVMVGDGPDNTGAGQFWSTPQAIATDVGCSNPDSVVLTPMGLMFQSSKGIYLLSRDLQTQYIGSPVEAYNSQTVTAARVVPGTTQVRFHCSGGRTLVYDYFVRQWSTFSGVSGMDATVWSGAFVYLGQVGQVMKESGYVDYNGSTPAITITTVPIKFDGVSGYVRCRGFEIALLEDSGVPTYSIQVSVESNSSLNAYGTFGRQSSNPIPARQWVYLRAADAKTSTVRVQLQETTPPAGVVGIKFVGLRFEVGIKGGARQVPSTIKLG